MIRFLTFFIPLAFFGAALYAAYIILTPLAATKHVIIPRQAGFRGSVEVLAQADVIRMPLVFEMMAYVTGKAHRFKAGEYQFDKGLNAIDVMNMIVDGEVVLRKFTVPEGSNMREVIHMLEAEKTLSGATPTDVKEGQLLPETYYFTYGDSRASMVKRMQGGMKKLMDELWQHRDPSLPLATPEEAVTLASIVEEETGRPEERARIAGVFFNRLKMGMKLQSDPTILYGLGRGGKNDNRAITREDIVSLTAYNTYVIEGLPAGPISNPGRASLQAVMHPEAHDYIYFVADGRGGHAFARSLAEHNENVRNWKSLSRQD